MTALQVNLEDFGRYAAAHRLATARRAVATTGSDLRLVEREESPTALAGVRVIVTAVNEDFLTVHRAATSVAWTADIPNPDDVPISSPFHVIDERRSEAKKVSELIGLIRKFDELPFAKRLARRFEDLVRIVQEEEPDQSEISSESLRMFFGFLKGNTEFSEPGVVLTPSGKVRVQWRAAPNKLCAVEFLRGGRVNFVVFAPDPHNPHQTLRLSGIAVPTEDFMGAVDRYGARRWMES